MVLGLRNKSANKVDSHQRNDDDDDEGLTVEDAEPAQPASELIGMHASAISLDGRSLILPDVGCEEDMSSLGTSKYGGGYGYAAGTTIGYVGNMRIVEKAEEYNKDNSLWRSSQAMVAKESNHDATLQNGDYDFQANDYSVRTEENYPNPLPKEEKKIADDSLPNKGCIPRWIIGAPLWLKLVIICSVALLVGAVVLIGVGASLAIDNNKSSSTTLDQSPTVPTPAPVTSPLAPVAPAWNEPGNDASTPSPPTLTPVATASAPADLPSNAPIENASPPLDPSSVSPVTATQAPTVVNFFVMGGRFVGENLATLTAGLQGLPNPDGDSILVHLGDWNSPYTTSCVEDSYIVHAEVYQQSNIPVYFVPGDNEFSDCPNPVQALGFWHEYLVDFETKHWQVPSWNVTRQAPDYPENFAFLNSRILFVGINLPGGTIHDQQEWDDRHAANLVWIDSSVGTHDGNFDILIVFGHADPDLDVNGGFFNPFFSLVQTYDEHVVFMHRNLGADTWKIESAYNDILNLDVVVVEGSVWPPMWVQVDLRTGTLSVDQSLWYDEYLSTGSLPSNEVSI